jgi:transcriptional regulator with XRE-family HTH domain
VDTWIAKSTVKLAGAADAVDFLSDRQATEIRCAVTVEVLPADARYLRKAEGIAGETDVLRQVLVSAATGADPAATAKAYQRLEDLVLDLSQDLPEGTQDYAGRKLFEYLVELRRALGLPAGAPLSTPKGRAAALLVLMKIGDVLRRLERRLEHAQLEDSGEAARYVFRVLADVPDADVAGLLGVSARTVGNWRRGGVVRPNDRVVLVAQLLTYLEGSMTQRGLLLWFASEQDALRRSPRELLGTDLGEARRLLVPLARGSRGQLAA